MIHHECPPRDRNDKEAKNVIETKSVGRELHFLCGYVSVSPLTNTEQSGSLPSEAVQWNFVGSVPIEENTPKLLKGDLIRPAPARFPDYLAEDKNVKKTIVRSFKVLY